MLEWRTSFAYPQNLLRNVAKAGCQTNYTFVPDIDMIPIDGLDRRLEAYLKSDRARECGDKCAYVVPVYEISTTSTHTPQNKTELVQQFIKKKKARQFHQVG